MGYMHSGDGLQPKRGHTCIVPLLILFWALNLKWLLLFFRYLRGTTATSFLYRCAKLRWTWTYNWDETYLFEEWMIGWRFTTRIQCLQDTNLWVSSAGPLCWEGQRDTQDHNEPLTDVDWDRSHNDTWRLQVTHLINTSLGAMKTNWHSRKTTSKYQVCRLDIRQHAFSGSTKKKQ